MKIIASHLIGAAIALVAVFLSDLDTRDAGKNALGWIEWEYDTYYTDKPMRTEVWDEIGLNGYEMVSMVYMPDLKEYLAVFKRPKLQPQ